MDRYSRASANSVFFLSSSQPRVSAMRFTMRGATFFPVCRNFSENSKIGRLQRQLQRTKNYLRVEKSETKSTSDQISSVNSILFLTRVHHLSNVTFMSYLRKFDHSTTRKTHFGFDVRVVCGETVSVFLLGELSDSQ